MIVTALSKGDGLESPAATIAMLETLQRMAKPDSPRSLKRSVRGLKTVDQPRKRIDRGSRGGDILGTGASPVAMRLPRCRDDSHSAAVKQALAVALATTSSARYEETLAELAATGRSGDSLCRCGRTGSGRIWTRGVTSRRQIAGGRSARSRSSTGRQNASAASQGRTTAERRASGDQDSPCGHGKRQQIPSRHRAASRWPRRNVSPVNNIRFAEC